MVHMSGISKIVRFRAHRRAVYILFLVVIHEGVMMLICQKTVL